MIDKTEIDRLRALAVDASKDDRSEPWSEFVKKSDAYRGASGPSVVIALLDALEAAQDDAARLDYLQNHGATVDLFYQDGWRFRVGGLHASLNRNIRVAIDAAMKERT